LVPGEDVAFDAFLKRYFWRFAQDKKKGVFMFTKHSETGFKPLLPGIQMRTLVFGEKSLLSEFHLAAGYQIPRHAHPHEQTGYMISGRMRFTLGEDVFEVEPGDSWSVPGGVEHSVEVLLDSVVIEVFSPVREDYLPKE
jgi:quercetin dioxygenase-like cupin family protein